MRLSEKIPYILLQKTSSLHEVNFFYQGPKKNYSDTDAAAAGAAAGAAAAVSLILGVAWAQGPQAATPNWISIFGLTGLVIRMGPWGIIQQCCMIHVESCRRCTISTHHAGHPTAWPSAVATTAN